MSKYSLIKGQKLMRRS